MIYFTAHTFKCVCHCRRAMFRVLGMYNFDTDNNIFIKTTLKLPSECLLSVFLVRTTDKLTGNAILRILSLG